MVPRNRGRSEKLVHDWPRKGVCAPESGQERKTCLRLAPKGRLCPETGAGAEKLDHGWPQKGVCAPESGQ
ncbi:MAG: hypothetical protein QM296_08810, partial [Bacillota bacterium]|nr:hypothetical protein [Bacillota bacterium]